MEQSTLSPRIPRTLERVPAVRCSLAAVRLPVASDTRTTETFTPAMRASGRAT